MDTKFAYWQWAIPSSHNNGIDGEVVGSGRTREENLLTEQKGSIIIFAYWFVPFKFIRFSKFLLYFLPWGTNYWITILWISNSPCTLITCFCFTYSFWNFDALFQPQQHPARDSHDTFYLKGLFHLIGWTIASGFLLIFTCHSCIVPSTTKELPEDYVERVKRVHESGGYGSRGYGIFFIYLSSNIFWISVHNLFNESFKWALLFFCPCSYEYDWSREEANKNLLRTHTTAVSARMLYNLAQDTLKVCLSEFSPFYFLLYL